MRKFSIFILFLVCLLVLSCGAKTNRVTSEVSTGEKLYRTKCRSCHNLIKPTKFKDEEWKAFVEKYGDRSGLLPEDKEKILKYLMENN